MLDRFHLFVRIPVNNEFDEENILTIIKNIVKKYNCTEYSYGYGYKRRSIYEMTLRIWHRDKIILYKIRKQIEFYEFAGSKLEWIVKRRNTHCIDD